MKINGNRLFAAVAATGLAVALSLTGSVQSASTTQMTIDAKKLFEKTCASCHGKDGRAKTFKAKFNKARNLTDEKWQESVTDDQLASTIKGGKDKMPSFEKKLSPEEITALVAYVRQFKGKTTDK